MLLLLLLLATGPVLHHLCFLSVLICGSSWMPEFNKVSGSVLCN
jgi:hypothetical protein